MFKFDNLKIRYKLGILTIFSFLSLIILVIISDYFYNTGKTLSFVINAERVHNLTFQGGIEDYYRYEISHDETVLKQALFKMQQANKMAYVFGNIDHLAKLPKKEFSDTLYAYLQEAFNDNLSHANLMAGRFKLFNRINVEKFKSTRETSMQMYDLGNSIRERIINDRTDTGDINTYIQADLDKMNELYKDFATLINESIGYVNKFLYIGFFLIVLILIFNFGLISFYISRSITLPIGEMVKQFSIITTGNLKTDLEIDSKNEIGELADSFRKLQSGFREVIGYAKKMAEGDYNSRIVPRSDDDEMSFALNKMAEKLKESNEKFRQDAWFESGLNNLNEKLDINDTPEEISKQSVSFLTDTLHSQLGGIYYFNNYHQYLEPLSYSGVNPKKLNKQVKPNEGIIGQVAYSKQMKILVDIPENLYSTFSATGSYKPKQLVVVPLIFNAALVGVLELASLYDYTGIELEFLKQVSDIIAIKLTSAESRINTNELLKKTQDQASELQVQQEELRVANEELTEHTKILTENEKKLQIQQEELRVANEELEERTRQLEVQKEDITIKNKKLTEAHEQLERKARELQQASKYKSEFLANMSHELRTPLNSLLILSNLLSSNKKGNLTEDQVQSAKIIHKSGSDLLHLINDILDLSKIESGKMNIEIIEVLPSDLQNEILMTFNALSEEKGLAFEVSIDPAFPTKLLTDRYRLMQIIKNLLSNAFKFTSKGKVTVDFMPTPENTEFRSIKVAASNTCCLKVSDTGVGIPEEKLESIFEAFQQADGSISRKFGGTGLGLSISRELIKLLGGEIHLKSRVSEGSTFYVYLPVESSQELVTQSVETVPIEKIKKPENEVSLKSDEPFYPLFLADDRDTASDGQTALIIHPSKTQAQRLMLQVREKNFKVIVAPTIQEGIYLAEKYSPKAIMLASTLAGNNQKGYLKLKNHKLLGKLPVHVISPIENDSIGEQQAGLTTLETIKFSEALESLENHFNNSIKKMLIVEDDRSTRILIKTLLEDFDLIIEETEHAEEAYQKLSGNTYDCVILDLGLPDYSGKELLEKLKTNHISIPKVIVYTGKEMSQQDIKNLSSYTDTIILKGIKSDERLMDEVTLFLHQVSKNIPKNKSKPSLANDNSVFKGKKILVVDDDIRNVFALGQMLEERDIEVIEADNGQVALDMLKQHNDIDLILMDVMMPVMNGYEAMKIIRKTPDIKNIPIICLTAKAMKEDHENALKNGANDYLSKPLNEEKLFSMLKIWLYKN